MGNADDAIARVQARADASRANRDRMRQEWPAHAALADWARSGGLEVAAVTVGGKTFGKPLPDAKPKWLLLTASEVRDALADGRIRIAGQQKDRHGRRRLGGDFPRAEEEVS